MLFPVPKGSRTRKNLETFFIAKLKQFLNAQEDYNMFTLLKIGVA